MPRLPLRSLLIFALVAALGVAAWYAQRPSLERLDRELGPLPVAQLDGTPILPASFAGRPWVVNVWMPG